MYFIGLFKESIRQRMLSSYYTIRHAVRAQQLLIIITIVIIIITYFSFITVYPPITEVDGIIVPNCQTKNHNDRD